MKTLALLLFAAAALSGVAATTRHTRFRRALLSSSPQTYSATQYQTQDDSGLAAFGYIHPGQSHAERRDAEGNVQGSYAYVDPDGKEVRVSYVADKDGFRIVNDLPAAPTNAQVRHVQMAAQQAFGNELGDTPEVEAAKREHFAAVAAAKARAVQNTQPKQTFKQSQVQNFQQQPVHRSRSQSEFLQPIEDTQEVKAAKQQHLAALAAANQRSLGHEKEAKTFKQQTFAAQPWASAAPLQPLEDTAEVKAAKAEHFAAVAAARARAAESPNSWVETTESVWSQANQHVVEDAPDVKAAKQLHFAALEAANSRRPAAAQPAATFGQRSWETPETVQLDNTFRQRSLPESWATPDILQPVEDTPEVKAAKEAHFAAVAAAKARALAFNGRQKRSVLFAPALAHHYAYTHFPTYPSHPAGVGAVAYSTPLAYAAPLPYHVSSQPLREATLTKTVLNPGHAVAYRVD